MALGGGGEPLSLRWMAGVTGAVGPLRSGAERVSIELDLALASSLMQRKQGAAALDRKAAAGSGEAGGLGRRGKQRRPRRHGSGTAAAAELARGRGGRPGDERGEEALGRR